jgi:uncharacterized protein YgfB (UPF0149 family)
MTGPVAYDDVARALGAAGSAVQAAEAHGCLCGALCARRTYGLHEWLDEILPDAAQAGHGSLAELHGASAAVLAGADLEFQPLLPDDEQALEARVEALGEWCQGFLYGFGAAGTAGRADLPGDVAEILADLARISQAGAVGSAGEETEEQAYAELVEFLRVGVQLVYDGLAAWRSAQPPATSH